MQIKRSITVLCFLMSLQSLIAQSQDYNPFQGMSADQIVSEISSALGGQDVDQIARALVGLPLGTVKQVLTLIIAEHGSPLDDNNKILLWLLTAQAHTHTPEYKTQILNLYGNKVFAKINVPVYLIAARAVNHRALIAMLVEWSTAAKKSSTVSQKMSKKNAQLAMQGLKGAIGAHDLLAVKRLFDAGVSISAEQADALLWQIIDANERFNTVPAFISLLAQHGADLNNNRKGYTPLIKAVENNNEILVRALVAAGASIKTMHSKSVGTALQMAIEKGYASLDEYLRSQGAKE